MKHTKTSKTNEKKFKKYFGLELAKYRYDAFSDMCGKDKLDMLKFYDYISKKHVIDKTLVDCIEREYGKEARDWYVETFL